jgi:hypothetical protein
MSVTLDDKANTRGYALKDDLEIFDNRIFQVCETFS